MKKRSMFLMSFALVLLLVVGGTMAWFTAEAEQINTFVAGTLEIELHDEFEDEEALNVNPGDEYDKVVYVENTGNNPAFIRIKLTPEFVGMEDGDFDLVEYPILNGWVLHTDGWYYYPAEVAVGDSTPNIIEEVTFAGRDMGNEYQGVTFTLNVEVEAIQTTNGAALDQWLVDPLTLAPLPL